jgi:hypothetical protein
MPKTHFQLIFLEKVKQKTNENHSLVDVITDVLQISKDAAYRRMRGETELSFDETVRLANHFRVSLSEVAGHSENSAVFQRQSFIKTIDNYREYLQNSLTQLEYIANQKNHMMYYQAKDIPAFYHYALPKLAAFKIYVWLKSVYGIDKIDGENYNLSMIPEDLIEIVGKQWEVFSRINSTEIWSETTIRSIINQIEYYYEAGFFSSKEEALGICDEFKEMMKIIYKQALNGRKVHAHNSDVFSSASYSMYFHEILLMDNHILTEFGEHNILYFIPYAGINYLSTADPDLTSDLKEFMSSQLKKAASVDNISEKERNRFFIRIKTKIDQLREKIISTDPFL